MIMIQQRETFVLVDLILRLEWLAKITTKQFTSLEQRVEILSEGA